MRIPLFTIRKASTDDAARLSELGATIFVQSYQFPYDQDAMDAYLDETFDKQIIAKEINKETIYYYVAETDGAIVGFIKFHTYQWSPRFKGKITFEIERLYIQKELEGNNIGSRLMDTALKVAKQKKYKIIWLSVWENNKKAIGFHQKHGFVIVGDGLFTLGKQKQKYLIMKYQ